MLIVVEHDSQEISKGAFRCLIDERKGALNDDFTVCRDQEVTQLALHQFKWRADHGPNIFALRDSFRHW